MDQIAGYSLWIGSIADARDTEGLFAAGIKAVIDLAASETPSVLPREMIYCRFPIVDGAGNAEWLLKEAVSLLVKLLREDVPTLVHCSAGLSRSPIITATALSVLTGATPEESMQVVADSHPVDPSPALWNAVRSAFDATEGR